MYITYVLYHRNMFLTMKVVSVVTLLNNNKIQIVKLHTIQCISFTVKHVYYIAIP